MFIAYSLDRTTRYALPSASEAEQAGAVLVEGDAARALSQSLACADPHCEAGLVYRQGESVRAHWAHAPGTADGCEETRGGKEGEWHRFVCRDLLGAALAHEYVVPGARADLVVPRRNRSKMTAFEVQHSPIGAETVKSRHAAHAAAGLIATVWVLDGAVALPGVDTDAWADPTRNPVVRTRVSWVIDLLALAQATVHHRCPVAVLVDTPAGHVLRLVDRVAVETDADGGRVAVVTGWSQPVPERVLRDWAAGPGYRLLDAETHPEVRVLDAAATRRVKAAEPLLGASAAKVAADRSRVRVMYDKAPKGTKESAVKRGLTWHGDRKAYSDGSVAEAARAVGPWTPQVEDWLASHRVPITFG